VKKIVIDASTVLISGGLSTAMNVINSFGNHAYFQVLVLCPRRIEYQSFPADNTRIKITPRWMLFWPFRPILDCFWVPRMISLYYPDIVLSLGNLPARTSYQQVFRCGNAFTTSDHLSQYKLTLYQKIIHRVRKLIVKHRMKYVEQIIVHSELEREKFINNVARKDITVIPHAHPIAQKKKSRKLNCPITPHSTTLLYPAHLFSHKNHEFLLTLAQYCKAKNSAITLLVTLDQKKRRIKQYLQSVHRMELNDYVVNLGPISPFRMPSLVEHIDGILVPSLIEAYSHAITEAWHFNKPLFISDLEYAHRLCGKAAFYLDVSDAEKSCNTILHAFANPQFLQDTIQQGQSMVSRNSWES
jgi:glycosyltransferase involved in cell wall biosynthesis